MMCEICITVRGLQNVNEQYQWYMFIIKILIDTFSQKNESVTV